MSLERLGDWGLTFSGRQFWPRDPRPGDVVIEDIAHGLANTCRFGGQCREFYSVAQHSVLVAGAVPPHLGLVGLLHDATEAYLGDVIRPLKRELSGYKTLEAMWALVIGCAFGLGDALEHLPPDVKDADVRVLSTEHRDLMAPGGPTWITDKHPPLEPRIEPWVPKVAERMFMEHFVRYAASGAPPVVGRVAGARR
jgi:hypothetical protein